MSEPAEAPETQPDRVGEPRPPAPSPRGPSSPAGRRVRRIRRRLRNPSQLGELFLLHDLLDRPVSLRDRR